jgi:hypothetical protein
MYLLNDRKFDFELLFIKYIHVFIRLLNLEWGPTLETGPDHISPHPGPVYVPHIQYLLRQMMSFINDCWIMGCDAMYS